MSELQVCCLPIAKAYEPARELIVTVNRTTSGCARSRFIVSSSRFTRSPQSGIACPCAMAVPITSLQPYSMRTFAHSSGGVKATESPTSRRDMPTKCEPRRERERHSAKSLLSLLVDLPRCRRLRRMHANANAEASPASIRWQRWWAIAIRARFADHDLSTGASSRRRSHIVASKWLPDFNGKELHTLKKYVSIRLRGARGGRRGR